MKKYVIRTGTGECFNAAGKARQDAETIAVSIGFEPFVFVGNRTANGSFFDAIQLIKSGIHNWRKLIRTTEPGSVVLFQYPHYPVKSAYLARRMIVRAQRKKGLRFIALIHDLDSVRGLHGRGAVYSDTRVLPLYDIIICHNEKMKALLEKQGIPAGKLISLEVFDYLTKADISVRTNEDGFAIAGNLNPEKCKYIMEWMKKAGATQPIHLYGKGLEKEAIPEEGIVLHGTFPPEELPGILKGSFGIVWDGSSAETCAGEMGEYLKYNNPHKLSLYLASAMPVVVWTGAAVASFVEKQGIGICMESLLNCADRLHRMPIAEWEGYRQNAERVGRQLRKGYYTRRALEKALERINSII